MGAMFRSDSMTMCDIFVQPEAAYDVLSELGDLGDVQFIDMNPELSAFQRSYVTEVRRCDEMERKMRYIRSQMTKEEITLVETKVPASPHPRDIIVFENILEKWQGDLTEMSENEINLKENYLELTEMYYVLSQVGPILGDTELRRETIARSSGDEYQGGRLEIICGVVRRDRSFAFEIMLWRVSRGNIFYRPAERDQLIDDPTTGRPVRKVAFVAFSQGHQLRERLKKVCNGFRVNIYPCPTTHKERDEMLQKLESRMQELKEILRKTRQHRCKALKAVAKQWMYWSMSVKKMKAIFHTMNMFSDDVTKKCLIGQCWVPSIDLPKVREALARGSNKGGSTMPAFLSQVHSTEQPPTFNRTNKFTKGFQTLIDAYGISTYREVNPGLYTIITFPFLFSIMFGDLGHGIILVMFSGWMVIFEKTLEASRSTNDIWVIMFGGRYIILLMGLFSLYSGMLYNDFFSKSMNVFGSNWRNKFDVAELSKSKYLMIDPKVGFTGDSYFFGMDPIWNLAENKIVFENSLKMKWSITIGVVHMLFGVSMSAVNHMYFKRYSFIFLEFIPQFLFLLMLFLYLVFMIFFKWFTYGPKKDKIHNINCAPSVLIFFIQMMLFSEPKAPNEGCPVYMYPYQAIIQKCLLITALLCIPVMLFGKPLYVAHKARKRRRFPTKPGQFRRYRQSDRALPEADVKEESEEPSFSDVMIHQAISTIEYVLSTISHTASYLRLWALSLAHAQLSEMLWQMVLAKNALYDHTLLGSVKIYVIYAVWAMFTLSILVLMEGLSAFLHTLRLHWVEFMSKFYEGAGVVFQPFSFAEIIYEDVEEKGRTEKG